MPPDNLSAAAISLGDAPVLPRIARPAAQAVTAPAEAGGAVGPGGIPMSSFQRALIAYQQEQMPTGPEPKRKTKKGGSGAGRLLRRLLVVGLVAGLGFGGWYVYTHYIKSPELPTFDSYPAYASATIQIADRGSPDGNLVITAVVDRSGSLMDMRIDEGAAQLGTPHMLINDVFSYTEVDGVWYRQPSTPDVVAVQAMFTSVVFADFVPDEARPFTTVVTKDAVTVDGVEVDRYDLRIDLEAFQKEAPTAAAAYLTRFPTEDTSIPVRVVLSVRDDGLVLRMESWSDATPSRRVEFRVLATSPDLPQIAFPTTYIDVTTGQQIG